MPSPDSSDDSDVATVASLSRSPRDDNIMTTVDTAIMSVSPTSHMVDDEDDQLGPLHINPTSSLSRSQQAAVRSRMSSMSSNSGLNGVINHGPYDAAPPPLMTSGLSNSPRPQRPGVGRTPSSTYAPARRPSQFALSGSKAHRSTSSTRMRLNPDADYRAQKKAYVQRIQQDNPDEVSMLGPDAYPPSLGYSTGSETEDESPNTADYLDNDPYDQETLLYYGNDDVQPSVEELKIPANRERLEWHSMLANVLTGDVVRQEKKRLIGASERQGDNSLQTEVWLGVRAKIYGRTVAAQKRMVDDQRSKIPTMLEAVIAFEIKGEAEVGKSPTEQVNDIVKKIETCESLYPTWHALEQAYPRAAEDAYRNSCAAVISWHNTTALINTELEILQAWVGNPELDFQKPRERAPHDGNLTDDASFIDRLLKEDGLKSLQVHEKKNANSMFLGIDRVINKAKNTLIENASAYADRHLPPYIEELLTLINFPSRLVQEVIKIRLSYARKIKDPNQQQNHLMADQMLEQFRILLQLAVRIRQAYTYISHPQPGWDLPPCIDENFEGVVLDAMRYYFKMLNWKLSANKNTFKEAEILEQEWDFCSELGRYFERGDVQVAEQFSSLTSRSLQRLTTNFEKELKRRPNEVAGPEMDRRYKAILDSVRVRQRKLFRFSRILTQTFENAAEFSIKLEQDQMQELYDNLMISGHILVNMASETAENVYFIASPSLEDQPAEIQTLLSTCYRAGEINDDPSHPYILVVCSEEAPFWDGPRIDIDMKTPDFDVKSGKLRLIADGSQQQLSNAKIMFLQSIKMELDVVIPQRANLTSVDKELHRIKRTAYKLSNTIMDSVETIRKQLVGLECHELIQNCFAFATEFGQRSLLYMDYNRRALNNLKLTRLALDWVSFICDDCIAYEKKTFRWAVVALEFAMVMTRGQNILSISDDEYANLRSKVAGCMSLLISHFDIMGARSTVAARAEKQRVLEASGGKLPVSRLKDDEESASLVREQWMAHLAELDESRKQREAERQWLGRVLEDSNEADRSLTFLSASATNVTLRWQQGHFIGGGSFGSVYAAINLDSGSLMAVKEIRLQDPQLIPTIVSQIRDEMGVLQILDHPNVVSYYGIEVHRDKVYIFMEFCSGGTLGSLLEHGRIEDETVTKVYALQLLEGLAYLHEKGVVHRDIKPENILLDHNGVIKYVDFGAAKVIARQGRTMAHPIIGPAAADGHQNQRSMTGTPTYMSPEVIKGTSQTTQGRPGAVDVWSLGCVILEMASGRRPWASLDNEWAIMYNIAQGLPPQLPTRDQLSDEGIDFLKRCFEKDPLKRASAAELLQHEWIMELRSQLNIEPQTPSDNGSSGSSSGGTTTAQPTRQNTRNDPGSSPT